MIIREKTTLEAWKSALAFILKSGRDFKDESSRICREYLNLVVEVENAAKEVNSPINILNSFKHWKYPPIAEITNIMLAPKLAPDYSYSYGPRIFNFQNKINQVNDFIIPLLKEVPNSRRAIISFWDPVQDSNTMKRDIPGLVSVDFKLRENRLNLVAVIRSNDLFFGWPANIYQLFTLQEYVRKKVGCESGSITTFSTSAHIFQDQFKYIKEVLKR